MAFSRIVPAGWAFGQLLTSTQMNLLDTDHANAVDGVGGGSYTPAVPIVIDGAGIRTNVPFLALGGAQIQGLVSYFYSTGNAFSGSVSFGGAVTHANTVDFAGLVTVTNSGFVTAGTTIAQLGGGGTIVTAPMSVQAATSFSDPVTLLGDASITERFVYGATSNHTYGVADADVVIARSTIGAGLVYTCTATDAEVGDTIEFLNYSANTVSIHNDATATLATLPIVNAVVAGVGVVPGRIVLRYLDNGVATDWQITSYTKP